MGCEHTRHLEPSTDPGASCEQPCLRYGAVYSHGARLLTRKPIQLWSDEPSPVDLLAFDAVAQTAADAVLDDALDPVALGVSGPWGSGKSTVLKLIETELSSRQEVGAEERILVVETDPWRYDPDVGAKATLILEVLNALTAELGTRADVTDEIQGALKKLARRVNWVKAVKLAARSSITLQLPGIDDLSSLVNEDDVDGDPAPRNLDEFRQDFAGLLADEQLGHVRRVVVLVDDLDRCLPDTIVDTLETMRLFLSVPKMSFVIAADEDRVADALRDRYPAGDGPDRDPEEPARLYLHKIVQTTLRLPALSRFDTEAYLLLLLLQNRLDDQLDHAQFEQILEGCTELRIAGASIDSISIPQDLDIATEMQFAARLTPILYEKLRGSPRRVKRFLNDLNVRSSIAERRGIELEVPVVAKLMVLELLLSDEFDRVLGWLARGELRLQLARLEEIAGRSVPPNAPVGSDGRQAVDDEPSTPGTENATPTADELDDEDDARRSFSDNLVRWAKLEPSLETIDLSPYLHLAASFTGTPVVDSGLPERLRDVAANLLSSSRALQKSVADRDIQILTQPDIRALIEHLGRMARDRPRVLLSGVEAILRVARLANATSVAQSALMAIPATEIKAPVVLLFAAADAVAYRPVLERWKTGTTDAAVKRAVTTQLKQRPAR